MKKLTSAHTAGNILLFGFAALVIFHVLILLGLVPPGIVWGGQANSSTSLVTLEVIAISATILFAAIIAMKMDYIKAPRFKKGTSVLTWLVFGYLVLNTLGNLASGVSAENFVFAPITFIMAVCALRVAIEK